MKKIVFFAVAVLAASGAMAEVVTLDKPGDWAKSSSLKFSENGIMEFSGGRRSDVFSTPFKLKAGKKYIFSAEFRSKPGTPAGVAYIGNWSISAKGKRILPENIKVVSNTNTTLLEAAEKNTVKVVIAKPAGWRDNVAKRHWNLVMNTQDDFSDLPNMTYFKIKDAQVDGDKVVLTLGKKLNKTYPAGTRVRIHVSSTGMYGGLSNKKPAEEWKKITWTVSGTAEIGTNPCDKWWPGATQGAIRIIGNYKAQKDVVLQVRNVTMEVVDNK
ncbi:MAG: hypothetical protein E7052_09845 [Lentisphaerae bacterium]|nr:hypothetical protein [Lentisphaerota bacterium]